MRTSIHLRILAFVAVAVTARAAEATYLNLVIDSYDFCANSTGSAHFYTNAPGPLTILWSNGATTSTVTGLAAGTIWVDVVDGQGMSYSDTAEVLGYAQLPSSLVGFSYHGAGELYGYIGVPCPGQCNGAMTLATPQYVNTTPLSFNFDVAVNYLGVESVWGFPVFSGFCEGGTANYTYTDINGCMGSGSFQVTVPLIEFPPQLWSVNATDYCSNGALGSVQLNPQFGFTGNNLTLYRDGNFIGTYVDTWAFNDLLPGHYTGSFTPLDPGFDGVMYPYQCGDGYFEFDINDLGPDCGKVEGDAWYDEDADCVFDAGEHGMNGEILDISGYPAYVNGGHYAMNLPAGNYQLSQADPYVVPICPAVQPVPFTVNANTTTIDLANGSTEPMDISLYLASDLARPGFNHHMHGSVNNFTPQPTGPVTVVCDLDADAQFVSAFPAPTVVGNTVTWDFLGLSYFGSEGFSATLFVPVGVPLGTDITHTCIATNTLPEVTLVNNSATTATVVSGSYDPNDKTARTSTGSSDTQYFIDQDAWIDYTIRFQNTGTDTAFTVVVTDTLGADLDMTTFEQGASSHPVEVAFRTGRVVKWTFHDILLPDSTTNETASHGLVNFRIKPVQPLVPGTVISNTANIFFDFNPPVITVPSVLITELSTQVQAQEQEHVSVFPNPANEMLRVTCSDAVPLVAVVSTIDGRRIQVPTSTKPGLMELDVRALAAGIYILRTDRGTARFVKR